MCDTPHWKAGLSTGLAGKTCVVQGFGNVGYWAAHFISNRGGAKVTAIAEYFGGIYNDDGLDIEGIWSIFRKFLPF